MDFIRQTGQAVRQLLPVHFPVAEGGGVVVSFAKPAVVHDEQLDAQVLPGLRQLQELTLINVKIAGLPAV